MRSRRRRGPRSWEIPAEQRPRVGSWWRSRSVSGQARRHRHCEVLDVYQRQDRQRADGTLRPGSWFVSTQGERHSTLRLDTFLRDYFLAAPWGADG